jgi:acetyl-CoA carboxylase biotin carboxyl carrier protein
VTTPTPTTIKSDLIRALAEVLDETKLTEIEYDADGIRIRVARQVQAMNVHHAAPIIQHSPTVAHAPGTGHDEAPPANAVTSPMVGVVYLSPEPGSPRFADVGTTVHEGQTLLLIEAMKTFNPIQATRAGKVTRILVTDGQPVEFGEPLVIVE